jgi:hypothetical protein
LLAHCDRDSECAIDEVAPTLLRVDRTRASVDFASPRYLSLDSPDADQIISACNQAGVLLPVRLVRPLFDEAMRRAVGANCQRYDRLAAASLEALALALGEEARPLLEAGVDHEQDVIQDAAARGLARLAGVEDPGVFVCDRCSEVGVDGLTPPQRVVYLAFVFDAEVCNGGIMQFFGNASGEHTAETLDALRELGAVDVAELLAAAMRQVGPLAREPDRDMRLAAFEDRYDELQAAFEPLETAYYEMESRLRRRATLYAAQHAEDFRSAPAGGDQAV